MSECLFEQSVRACACAYFALYARATQTCSSEHFDMDIIYRLYKDTLTHKGSGNIQ